jgi:phosphoenolpyruvate carboxylase
VEQSLWGALPTFMRHLSNALKRATGRDLPLAATPFRFSSWMGGDRDGNPNVTARVGGWMAVLQKPVRGILVMVQHCVAQQLVCTA